MSVRELVVLGTASQAPSRHRNHNGYLLRWDGEGILFDPGEGTQRQFAFAGVSPASVTRICVTHFHGDHCLGLPGMIQRLGLDSVPHTVDVHFPASGREYYERLRWASIHDPRVDVRPRPVEGDGIVDETPDFTLSARRLDHEADAFGYRLEEPPRRHFVVERLEELGIHGPAVGRLEREGSLVVGGRRVAVDEVSVVRPGQRFAFVMDTRRCDAALELPRDADLLVCESTFLYADADLAQRYGHLTAADAAWIAREAGARRLVLTHFSQRYPDEQGFLDEAGPIFPDVVAARDLDRIDVPKRA
jgi:ribonuclease Z